MTDWPPKRKRLSRAAAWAERLAARRAPPAGAATRAAWAEELAARHAPPEPAPAPELPLARPGRAAAEEAWSPPLGPERPPPRLGEHDGRRVSLGGAPSPRSGGPLGAGPRRKAFAGEGAGEGTPGGPPADPWPGGFAPPPPRPGPPTTHTPGGAAGLVRRSPDPAAPRPAPAPAALPLPPLVQRSPAPAAAAPPLVQRSPAPAPPPADTAAPRLTPAEIEAVARQVYERLRRRLAVERERMGGHL